MKLQLSPHCRFIESEDNRIFAYNTLRSGSLREISRDMFMILRRMTAPISAEELAAAYDVPYNYMHHFLEVATKAWLLQKQGDDQRQLLNLEMSEVRKSSKTGRLLNTLTVNTTLKCNLRCNYCFVNHIAMSSPDRKKSLSSTPTLSPETAYKTVSEFVKYVGDTSPNREIGIGLIGGEPILAWPTVEAVLRAIERLRQEGHRIVVGITTNATAVTPAIADALKNHNVTSIVSLDGFAIAHDAARRYPSGVGSFKHVIKGIEILKSVDIDVIMQITMGEHNWNKIDDSFFAFLTSLGIKLAGLNFDDSSNWLLPSTNEVLNTIIELFETAARRSICLSGFWYKPLSNMIRGNFSFCGTGHGGNLHLEADGSIYACNRNRRRLCHASDISKAIESLEFKNLAGRLPGTIDKCIGCDLEGHCVGGCTAIAEHFHGGSSQSIDERMCDIYRLIIPSLLKNKVIRNILLKSKEHHIAL